MSKKPAAELRRPTFFIIGAPKCGTTSLANALSAVHSIYMPQDVEPNHFCSDLRQNYDLTHDDYLKRHFRFVGNQHKLVGEKSTWNLMSGKAAKAILDFQPDAKFIAVIRNPVEAAPSLHAELRNSNSETIQDFDEAWGLETTRRDTSLSTTASHVPGVFLQYKRACSFGTQLRDVLQVVPRDRLLILLFEDLTKNSAQTLRKVFEFLEIDESEIPTFPHSNERLSARSQFANRLLTPPQWSIRAATALKKGFNIEKLYIGDALFKIRRMLNFKKAESKALSPQTKDYLTKAFSDEIRLIEEITGRDLRHWLTC